MNKQRNIFKVLIILVTIILLAYTYMEDELGNTDTYSDYVSDGTRLHFIDVGQGDSALIESNGEFMLIDAGEYSAKEKVNEYLKNLNVSDIKYVIATHPHSDHIGSMASVINNFNVENIILPEVSNNGSSFENMAKAIQQKNVNVIEPKVGDNYSFGDCSFTIIAPYTVSKNNLNNDSVGIKLVHGNDKAIFMGDSGSAVEKQVLKGSIDVDADLLKASHHGSNSANSAEFLKAVSPQFVIISCGKDNDYGHPHKEPLLRFKECGAKIYRTDECGDIVIESTGNGMECVKGFASGSSLSQSN